MEPSHLGNGGQDGFTGHGTKTVVFSVPRRSATHKPMCFSVPRRPHRRTQSRAFNIERKDAKKLLPRIGNINIFRNATFQNHVNCRSSLPKDVPRAEVFSEIYAPAYTPCMFLPSWPKATSPEPWKKLFCGETDVFKCMGFLDVPFQNTFRGLMVFCYIATLPACGGEWPSNYFRRQ